MTAPLDPTEPPEVSVVIPSKDRPELVRRAMLTALAQEGVALEVIVVDDGSTPPVVAPNDDPRVRIIRHPQAQGVAAARNRGVAEARGRWVAFLDDDDLWSPRKLAVQLAAMRRTGARWSYPGTVVLNGQLRERWRSMPHAGFVTERQLTGSNAVGSPSGVLAEVALVREAGGFDSRFSTFADWDMWLRMSDHGAPLGVTQFLVGYVTHDGSMHRQELGPLVQELRRLRGVHAHRGRIARLELWKWIADGQRDCGRPFLAAGITAALAVRFTSPMQLIRAIKIVARVFIPKPHPGGPVREAWVREWQA